MMVNKKDRTGGQVRDESGDPVTVRVWRQETTGRQWDMLERTLFHDTSDRPIRVCIGACPSPDAWSAPPQPHAGEEARGGAPVRGGLWEGPHHHLHLYILAHTNPHKTLGWQPGVSQGVDMRPAQGALAPLEY